MALPKKIKKDINLLTPKPGINPYLGGGEQFIEQNPANLPRGVDFADLDNGFVDWVGKDLNVVVEGELVPVSFLTAQRWSEFTRTWQNSDKYKNIKIPFISVVRNPDVQKGTNPEDFNIPLKDYRIPYMTVPTWDGSKKGADVYLIPQPVKVDVTYTLRFFTYRMSELNVLNQKVFQCNLTQEPDGANAYWDLGAVHPEYVLSDFAKMFHAEKPDFATKKYYFYQQLK